MRKIFLGLSLLICASAFGQSETNNMITYDTLIKISTQFNDWAAFRITRPANYFTPGHADTASRQVIFFLPGAGEMPAGADTSTLKTKLGVYGPHWMMANTGWNGSIQTGSGTHYPIFITLTVNVQNVRPASLLPALLAVIDKFHPRGGKVHMGGLSMGAFTIGRLYCYKAYAGDDRLMSRVASLLFLQGQANDLGTAYNLPGYESFSYGASTYGLKVFGLEGTNDTRSVWKVTQPMNAAVPGSAYFAFENIGAGANGLTKNHCCWNDMLDRSRTNWNSVSPPSLGANVAINNSYPNTMGTYKIGNHILQWQFKQGDTTLAGASAAGPVANAGPDQSVTTTTATLSGSGSSCNGGCTISTYLWEKVSGPSGGTISNTAIANPNLSGLNNGTYVFRLTVTDNSSRTKVDEMTLVKSDPSNTLPTVIAGVDRTIKLPADSIHLDASATDADGSIIGHEISQKSGPGTAIIEDINDLNTAIRGLTEGVWTFVVKATDNSNATAADEMVVTVINSAAKVPSRIKARVGSTTFLPNEWNNLVNPVTPTPLINERGEQTGVSVSISNSGVLVDNGANYGSFTGSIDWPATVLRYATSASGDNKNRVLRFTGLDPSASYNLYFLASRSSGSSSTIFTIREQKDTVTTFSNKSVTADFSTISPEPDGTLTVQITTAGVSYFNAFILEEQGVSEQPNRVPTVTIPQNITITLPTSSVNLTATDNDPEKGDLVRQWSSPNGGSFTSGTDTTLSTTLSGLTQGTYYVTFASTDTGGLTGSQTLTIIVNAAGNALPTANAGSDKTISIVLPATTATTTLSGTDGDTDGTIVARQWRVISGPSGWNIVSPGLKETQIGNLLTGAYSIEYSVTDNKGGTKADTMILTVSLQTTFIPSVQASPGEYQVYFIDKQGYLWGLGNTSNIGAGNPGSLTAGVPYRVTGPARNVRFKKVIGALHGGAAIDEFGNLWTMGDGDQFQRGNGIRTNTQYEPSLVVRDSLGRPFTDIDDAVGGYLKIGSTGSNYFVVHKKDNTAYIFGQVIGGLLGNNTDSVTYHVMFPHQLQLPGGLGILQITAGNTIIALATDSTVWVCGRVGDYANLGYKGSGFDYRSWRKLDIPTKIARVLGGGSINYALAADSITLYGWGQGNYMGDGFYPTGGGIKYETPRILTRITSAFPAGSKIADFTLNYVATHYVLKNSDPLYDNTLWGNGDNAQSGVGNGKSLDWQTYDWAWPATPGMLFEKTPVQIAPGRKFKRVASTNTYGFTTYAVSVGDTMFAWGRNKASLIPNQITGTSATNDTAQNFADVKWATAYPNLFSITTSYPSYTPTQAAGMTNTRPDVTAGSSRTITTNWTTLDGSASTDPDGHIGWYEWSQVSGPAKAVLSTPGNAYTGVLFPSDGSFQFMLVGEDNLRKKDTAYVTITVAQNGNNPPTASINSVSSITLPTNEVQLNGIGTDPDAGSTVTYLWEIVSGSGTLSSSTIANPKITGMTAGVTVVQLKVKDQLNLESQQVQFPITVNPAPVTQPQNPPKQLPGSGSINLGKQLRRKF